MTQNSKYRINALAKDLGMKSADIINLLKDAGIDGKTYMSVLAPEEFAIIFETLTQSNQITNMNDYLAAKADVEEKDRPVKKPKTPKKPKEEKTVKEEKPSKVEKKPEESKEEKKPEQKKEPVKEPVKEKKEEPKKPVVKTDVMTETAFVPNNNKSRQGQGTQKTAQPSKPVQTQTQKPAQSAKPAQSSQKPASQPQRLSRSSGNKQPDNLSPEEQARLAEERRVQSRDKKLEKFADRKKEQPASQSQKPEKKRNEQKTTITTTGGIAESGVTGKRVVDTRTVDVDLTKYDEKLESFVPDNGSNYKGEKQKLKKKNTQTERTTRSKPERDRERYNMEKMRRETIEKVKKQPLQVTIPDEITVGELAQRLKVTAGEVVKRLMTLGVMASINDVIEYDTAFLVADELGAIVTKEVVVTIEERLFHEEEDAPETLKERSPVVCVMGHVDHGKTSLLDAIRHTSVTKGEAGGITQHIGAYRVTAAGKEITFLDTPGHEAFTAMRARGAKSTDIAILVVAADDGIMPQTVEAINHAKAAEVPLIVAINKMDKPHANPEAVKQELTKYDLIPEEWGGDTIVVPVSALTGKGIDSLLEMVLLVAEMKELKANPDRAAKGIIVESRLDKGRGPVATVIVQNGTLHSGDIVIAGTAVGHVRAMTDDKGRKVKSAGPSVPVEIIGLSEVPIAGDEFNAVADEKMARELAEQRKAKEKEAEFKLSARASLDDMFTQISAGVKDFNVIVKADVAGSAEAVCAALLKLSNEEVRIRIIHSAVGGIVENDVMLAAASQAIIIGFNVRPDRNALDSAERSNVEIRTYRIIYECIEEMTAAMSGMLAPEYKEVLLGHAEVRQTIRVPNVGTIAGSYITDGKITRASLIRVLRESNIIFEDKISSLRRFKDDVKEVASGYECGIGLERFNDIKVGDIFEAYIMEEIKR